MFSASNSEYSVLDNESVYCKLSLFNPIYYAHYTNFYNSWLSFFIVFANFLGGDFEVYDLFNGDLMLLKFGNEFFVLFP